MTIAAFFDKSRMDNHALHKINGIARRVGVTQWKKSVCLMLLFGILLSLGGCRKDRQEIESTPETVSLAEKFPGIETGILLEGCKNTYWKPEGDRLTLFGEGSVVSMAMNYFPWKRISDIKTVVIESGIGFVGEYALWSMDELSHVEIEDGCLAGLGMGCFASNKSLESVRLGNSLASIPMDCFNRCESLREIYIPRTVKTIKSVAFGACDSLQYVYYSGSEAEWNDIVIEAGNEALERAEIIFEG